MVRRHQLFAALIALALLGSWQSYAADPPPGKEQIARWVEQLGDRDFDRRQEASKRLWASGEPAEKPLEAALKSDDAEVRRRAEHILSKFKWGIYPDTPKNVLDLIGRYQGAQRPAKVELLRDLLNEGVPGCRALVKIADADDDAQMREQVLRVIGGNVSRFLPVALVDDKFDLIERLLDLGVQSEDLDKTNLSHYCAYWLFRGKLDERIKELSAKANRTKRQSELLAYLYRAKGDLHTAKTVAEKADLGDLTDRLLYERGDWKELAKRDLAELPAGPERLGYRAAYQRLVGDAAGFEDALARFRKAVDDAPPPERSVQSYYLAKVLFLNDRPDEALQVLERSGHYAMLFELLCVQFKYREAFALVDRARKEGHAELPLLEILEARQRYLLGDTDKALALFARRGAEIKPGNDFRWFADLVDAEYRVGRKDEAFAHAATVLAISADTAWQWRLFSRLFPGRANDAEAWWTILRQRKPTLTAPEAIKQLRDLLEGKYTGKEVAALIEEAQESAKNLHPALVERYWLALANTAHAARLDKLEWSCLEKGASAATLQRLGDLLAEKKDWGHAAKTYRQAWDRTPTQPLPLFLAGKALVEAGDEKEGKKLVEESHWLPLGDDGVRNEFAIVLGQRGYADDARRENELIERLGVAGSFYGAEAEFRTAIEALRQKNYLKAAAGQEYTLLRCLKTTVDFIQNPPYLGVPALAHRSRARGLLDAGKFEEAQKEIAYCRAALPGDVDLAILLVPELERRGHQKEADELFARTAAVYEKVNADYPKCPWAHNSIAWLSVCCRRDLDKALAHAKQAVELAPQTAGHHDTLAEIYFQLGRKEKAIAEQKKAVELDPKRAYFRKQLRRIEAGDPKAERPSELDDED